MAGIDHVCSLLPGPAASLCKEEVDKMLPLAITFFTGVAVSEETASFLISQFNPLNCLQGGNSH